MDDCCEECHDWSDERCQYVDEYVAKLLLHQEKKRERKVKASSPSSSFSGFSSIMPVPLCQLPSPSDSGIVMTTPSSSVCAVTYSASALIVSTAPLFAPLDVTPVEQDHKWHRVESPVERAKMLVRVLLFGGQTMITRSSLLWILFPWLRICGRSLSCQRLLPRTKRSMVCSDKYLPPE